MDLNFGEILIDQSSRAFYDDYDDFNLNRSFDRPEWKWAAGAVAPRSAKRIVVVEGVNAHKITQAYAVKSIQPLATARGMSVYDMGSGEILCVVEEQDINCYSSMAELLETFHADESTIVSLQPASEFKGNERPDGSTIRAINSKFEDIPILAAPNFITGVAAGIASKRIMSGLSFDCYVIYVDIYDEQTVKVILNQFRRINLPYDETLKIKPLHHKSDLYM